jgi:predicted nucleic acid-binding protein
MARALSVPQRRLLSPFVLAEVDYLISRAGGHRAEQIVLQDVARGAFQLEAFSNGDVGACSAIIEQYADLELGLADASIVHLAHRFDCLDVLTLDERHFRALRGPESRPFRIVPADELTGS